VVEEGAELVAARPFVDRNQAFSYLEKTLKAVQRKVSLTPAFGNDPVRPC